MTFLRSIPGIANPTLRSILLRLLPLILIATAFLGPWAYNLDGVPPPEYCADPFILVPTAPGGDLRCANLIAGTEVLAFWGLAFLQITWGVLTGSIALAQRTREVLVVFLFPLLVLPLASLLVLQTIRNARAARVFSALAWALALLPAGLLWLSIFLPSTGVSLAARLSIAGRLWGLCLFTGTGLLMVWFESISASRMQPARTG